MTFDEKSVRTRIQLIAGYLEELELLRRVDLEEILDDVFKYRAAERLQELVIQASIDISRHLLAEFHGISPATNADVFINAAKAGILPIDLANKLSNAGKFRNFLAHQYDKINPLLVVKNVESVCIDFERYLDCIEDYLDSFQENDDTTS